MGNESDTVFLTGASGFVGSHVLRALLDGGYRIRALTRSNDNWVIAESNDHERVKYITGDLHAAGTLTKHLRGCRYLVHVAALYSFAPGRRAAVWTTNVRGTASILEAARIAGVEKVVVTSSSATVGPARNGRLPNEEDWAVDYMHGPSYHRSKLVQERVTLAAQMPTVLVLPTTPVGPGDSKPTPTGKMIVDAMKGRLFATLGGGLNIVPVEDVARAHVLALERGTPGDRYLVGGENMTLMALFSELARINGRRPPRFELPFPLAFGFASVDELRCLVLRNVEPIIPLEGVWMGREKMFISSEKAERELGYRPGSASDALGRAVVWFRDRGYA